MTDFKALYDRHAGDIYRFALFLSGNEADAKDITAETFARALTGKSPLKTATVKGYLLTIARNLYLESLRKKGRMAAMPAGLQDKSPDPGQQLHGKLELEALMRFLQNFPEPDRAALLLRADGVPYSEIAENLNISLASARVKVHRLRWKLTQWRANREQ